MRLRATEKGRKGEWRKYSTETEQIANCVKAKISKRTSNDKMHNKKPNKIKQKPQNFNKTIESFFDAFKSIYTAHEQIELKYFNIIKYLFKIENRARFCIIYYFYFI